MEILADLMAEQDRLEDVLKSLSAEEWLAPSGATGWSVADVVLHLAQTEEAVAASAAGNHPRLDWRAWAETVDEAMDQWVCAQRTTPTTIFARWKDARRAAVTALQQADPARPLPWVTGSRCCASCVTTPPERGRTPSPTPGRLHGGDLIYLAAVLQRSPNGHALALLGGHCPDELFAGRTATGHRHAPSSQAGSWASFR